MKKGKIKMNQLDMKSEDIVNSNIECIKNIFLNTIVESEQGYAIDFDALKQELSNSLIEGPKEKYQLTWPGKKESIVLANTPTTNTLRPIREKSVDFDKTENIYIEGDNLDSLKILQESYLGKIKCIYIDPPYNTGHDFIYNDNYSKEMNRELIESGQIDEYGNRLITNNESNGKFHSDWLSMMYSRLKLARNLLSKNGVIFISIDDNEVDNLKKICNEIFGEYNFIAQCVRKRRDSQANLSKNISPIHEYILIYARNNNGEILNRVSANININEYSILNDTFAYIIAQSSELDKRRNCENTGKFLQGIMRRPLIPLLALKRANSDFKRRIPAVIQSDSEESPHTLS